MNLEAPGFVLTAVSELNAPADHASCLRRSGRFAEQAEAGYAEGKTLLVLSGSLYCRRQAPRANAALAVGAVHHH